MKVCGGTFSREGDDMMMTRDAAKKPTMVLDIV